MDHFSGFFCPCRSVLSSLAQEVLDVFLYHRQPQIPGSGVLGLGVSSVNVSFPNAESDLRIFFLFSQLEYFPQGRIYLNTTLCSGDSPSSIISNMKILYLLAPLAAYAPFDGVANPPELNVPAPSLAAKYIWVIAMN
jgi:hypothetical protein